MLELSNEDRELLKEAIGEEALKKIDEYKAKRHELDNADMKVSNRRNSEYEGVRSLSELILWHLAPIACIARGIEIECDESNYVAVDTLANDLRIRINEMWDTCDRWVGYQIEGRLSDMKKEKAPAKAPESAAAGA